MNRGSTQEEAELGEALVGSQKQESSENRGLSMIGVSHPTIGDLGTFILMKPSGCCYFKYQ